MVSLCCREKGKGEGREDRDGLRQSQAPIVRSNPSPPRGGPPRPRDARVHRVLLALLEATCSPSHGQVTDEHTGAPGATSRLPKAVASAVLAFLLSSLFSPNSPPPPQSIGTHKSTCTPHILASQAMWPSQPWRQQPETRLSYSEASENHLGARKTFHAQASERPWDPSIRSLFQPPR